MASSDFLGGLASEANNSLRAFYSSWQMPPSQIQCSTTCQRSILESNTTLVGSTIINTFFLTSIITGLAALGAVFAEWRWWKSKKVSAKSKRHKRKSFNTKPGWRLMRCRDALTMLSEQQTIVGIVLAIAAARQGCSISVYEYNNISYLLLMAVYANIIAFLNVPPQWYHDKSRTVVILQYLLRFVLLIALVGLTGNMILGRGSSFPTTATISQTFPAVCFTTRNATAEWLSYIDDIGHAGNATISGTIDVKMLKDLGNAWLKGNVLFVLMALFTLFAIFILVLEMFAHIDCLGHHFFQGISIWGRILSSLGAVSSLGWLLYQYLDFRNIIEHNPNYFKQRTNSEWNMSNVLAWALFFKAVVFFFINCFQKSEKKLDLTQVNKRGETIDGEYQSISMDHILNA